jgi:hypothetical protein
MRRRIEFFQRICEYLIFSLDSLFSSLPLLTAKSIIATDLLKTKT